MMTTLLSGIAFFSLYPNVSSVCCPVIVPSYSMVTSLSSSLERVGSMKIFAAGSVRPIAYPSFEMKSLTDSFEKVTCLGLENTFLMLSLKVVPFAPSIIASVISL